MKVKTADLTGPALDWAVCKCELPEGWNDAEIVLGEGTDYSTDWAQGGPIIEREIVSIDKEEGGKRWAAFAWRSDRDLQKALGPTPLIAAMRCYVASKLGDTIEVPEELQ